MKRCSIGKSCGATCIDRREDCVIELPPEISKQMSSVRDFLESLRESTVSQYGVLDTPEKAAAWILKNKEELASWAIPAEALRWAKENKPEVITFGYEPGIALGFGNRVSGLKDALPLLKQSPEIRELGKGREGPWGDQLLKANAYKVSSELSNALNKIDSEKFSAGRTEIARLFSSLGLDVKAMTELLAKRGQECLLKKANLDVGGVAREELNSGRIGWGTIHGLALKGLGSPGGKLMPLNPSGLSKPSTDFGQFKELMAAAKIPKEQAAPFQTNASWYKYSGQKITDKVLELIREGEPKMVYFGGKESDSIKVRLAEQAVQTGIFRLESVTQGGKPISKPFEYFLVQQPNGARTTVIFGPHGGAMGFGSNRSIMEGVGEFAKYMNANGDVPKTLSTVKVTDVVGGRRGQVSPVSGNTKKVAEKALKEISPPKIAKPVNKPVAKQVDKGKQLAAIKLLVVDFQKKGYPAVRIRQELQKLGVPANLVTEVI